jgi:hypothetical protein
MTIIKKTNNKYAEHVGDKERNPYTVGGIVN